MFRSSFNWAYHIFVTENRDASEQWALSDKCGSHFTMEYIVTVFRIPVVKTTIKLYILLRKKTMFKTHSPNRTFPYTIRFSINLCSILFYCKNNRKQKLVLILLVIRCFTFCSRILILLWDHMLLTVEKIISTGDDVRGVGQYTGWADWMLNRDFLVDWLGRRDNAIKPGLSRLKRDVWYA